MVGTMATETNPLIDDRLVDFLLWEVLDASTLCDLPYFADHSRETFELYLGTIRRYARDVLFPTYGSMDAEPPVLRDGHVHTHPKLPELYRQMTELGVITAARPAEVGGQQLPLLIAAVANTYLMAGNLSASCYPGLTAGAAHLVEAFGDDDLRERFMLPMYDGRFTGTMALTEPHAGSSLGDLTTSATPAPDGSYRIRGSKIFISGADHDVTDNIINLTLARIAGAPEGTKGISLFAVPKRRLEGGAWVDNDVSVAGSIHKIGWKGFPSLAINFGERDDCHGWLVGEPHQGLRYMFQMMNEARLMVGWNGVATASVAYHEAKSYAHERTQGRPPGALGGPMVPIVEHADVRRMLLRQKAIVEGGFCLLAQASMWADRAEHAVDDAERERAHKLLSVITPIAKSFPAEKGFESNALAVQIHGGYGYSSEYPVEAWLRDQKLNSIHEGTTGIQSLDLLGRKAVSDGGASMRMLGEEIARAVAAARAAELPAAWCDAVERATADLGETTLALAGRGMQGDASGMLSHSVDYLDAFSTVVVGWQWLVMATAAARARAAGRGDSAYLEGLGCAAQYWIVTELPKAHTLLALCRSLEDSFVRMRPEWF